jgi:type VI secretion system protein ImpC
VNVQPEAEPVEAGPDDPFRILIVGDFSGREHRPTLAERRPQRIDRDNFDDVLQKMGVRAAIRLTPAAETLTFAALSDFEPDAIFARCELFRESPPPPRAAPPVAATRSSVESIESDVARLTSGSLLDEIVEESDVTRPSKSKDGLQSVIDRVVAPYLEPREDRSAIEHSHSSHSSTMRAILHHPRFQALEAAWRGIDMLVRGLDTDGVLSLHILDVTRQEVERSLDDLPLGAQPWALIAANYTFDRSVSDVALLGKLGALAHRLGAPFIAESVPPDGASEDSEWHALRASSDARWIGLALPRFLARMPYGSETYAIESFPFEETSGRPPHNEYLWANPAFVCALLLGRAFNEAGWSLRPGTVRQIDGLPCHSFEAEGEMESQPCTEVLLTDRQIEFIHDQGLMALAAMKNTDVAMLVRFHSIADPIAVLAGRWGA